MLFLRVPSHRNKFSALHGYFASADETDHGLHGSRLIGDFGGVPAAEENGYMNLKSSTVLGVFKVMRGEDPR